MGRSYPNLTEVDQEGRVCMMENKENEDRLPADEIEDSIKIVYRDHPESTIADFEELHQKYPHVDSDALRSLLRVKKINPTEEEYRRDLEAYLERGRKKFAEFMKKIKSQKLE